MSYRAKGLGTKFEIKNNLIMFKDYRCVVVALKLGDISVKYFISKFFKITEKLQIVNIFYLLYL